MKDWEEWFTFALWSWTIWENRKCYQMKISVIPISKDEWENKDVGSFWRCEAGQSQGDERINITVHTFTRKLDGIVARKVIKTPAYRPWEKVFAATLSGSNFVANTKNGSMVIREATVLLSSPHDCLYLFLSCWFPPSDSIAYESIILTNFRIIAFPPHTSISILFCHITDSSLICVIPLS